MIKLYTYTIRYKGNCFVTDPVRLGRLLKQSTALASAVCDLVDQPAIKDAIRKTITEIKAACIEVKRSQKQAAKEAADAARAPNRPCASDYAYVKAWRQANPDKVAVAAANRKLRKAGLIPSIAEARKICKIKRLTEHLSVVDMKIAKCRRPADAVKLAALRCRIEAQLAPIE